MVAFDTDHGGTYGNCCDISLSCNVGDEPTTASQKQLNQIAYEDIITNMGLIEAGKSFAEMTNIAHRLP